MSGAEEGSGHDAAEGLSSRHSEEDVNGPDTWAETNTKERRTLVPTRGVTVGLINALFASPSKREEANSPRAAVRPPAVVEAVPKQRHERSTSGRGAERQMKGRVHWKRRRVSAEPRASQPVAAWRSEGGLSSPKRRKERRNSAPGEQKRQQE